MKIVYMGTPEFAVAPLERLVDDGHEIVGVFTQPDKPRSRGMRVSACPVKEAAVKLGFDVYQPETLRDGAAERLLHQLSPDLLAVVAYGKLLPESILAIPPLGSVNIHASLLPRYRGAAPIQWAILNGDAVTGVTSMYLSTAMDEGDVIYSRDIQIQEGETAGELSARLSDMGALLLSGTVADIEAGIAPREPQNQSEATYAPPLSKEMSAIDWEYPARMVMRQIYGLQPWPTAVMEFQGILLKVLGAELTGRSAMKKPGETVSAGTDGIEIACRDGETLLITEVQAPGKKRMRAADYLRGLRNSAREKAGS